MRTALVVFNPIAGMRWRRRDSELQALLRALTRAGVKTLTTTTRGPQHPPGELFDGLEDFDTVLAVGGDGTVNEVLQALMISRRDAALGVVPLGSGNLLAKELGGRHKLEGLVEALTQSAPQPSPVGCVEQLDSGARRYWLAAAGVGADARVICALSAKAKAKFGIAAYYAESTRQLLFSRQPLPLFEVQFEDVSTGRNRVESVTQVVAERIGYFGCFLEPGDAPPLPPDQMRLVFFKNARASAFLNYGARLLASQLRRHVRGVRVAGVEVARTRQLICRHAHPAGAGGGQKILAEVDGELIGGIPVRLSLAARQIRLLRPRGSGQVALPGLVMTDSPGHE